jgi:cation diffusion facilitator family transporter
MMADTARRRTLSEGRIVAFAAAGMTIIMAFMKYAVGRACNCQLLVSDAFHSMADSIAVLLPGLALWLASRAKSTKFPYGLYRAENIAAALAGIFIFWGAIHVAYDSYSEIVGEQQSARFPVLGVAVTLLSMGATLLIAQKERATGMAIGSDSLLANAKESFLDLVISGIVLCGLLFDQLGVPYIEGICLVAITFLMLRLGYETLSRALLVLVDANLCPSLQFEIATSIRSINGVWGVREVRIRLAGPYRIIECDILTDPVLPVHKAHNLADKIESLILASYKSVESVFVHVEPSRRGQIWAVVPVSEQHAGLGAKVMPDFGNSPYFLQVSFDDSDIKVVKAIRNEHLSEERYRGVKVVKQIIRDKVDLLFTSHVGEIPLYLLRDNFVEVAKAEPELTVTQLISRYREGRVQHLSSPSHTIESAGDSVYCTNSPGHYGMPHRVRLG